MNGLENTLSLKLRTYQLQIDIILKHRFNTIIGLSGTCKSLFASIIGSPVNAIDGDVTCNYRLVVVTSQTFALAASEGKHCLLVIDEEDLAALTNIQEIYSQYAIANDQYYLLITREVYDFKKISYSLHAIYKFVQVSNTRYILSEMYSFLDSEYYTVDGVVTEGTGSIYTFSVELFNKLERVLASKSKSEIENDISVAKNMAALVDTSAFGCHAAAFAYASREHKCSLFYNVESFEQLLLQFCKDYLSDIHLDPLDYISLEAYFEAVMEKLPKECRFITKHKRPLAPCILDDCDTCTKREHINCKCAVSGDKFVYALKDTEFEYLLKYHKIKEATE